MSADDLHSVHNSSVHHQVCLEDVPFQPSHQGRVVNVDYADGGDAIGSTLSAFGALPSGNSVVAPVNLTEYIDKSRSTLDAWKFA